MSNPQPNLTQFLGLGPRLPPDGAPADPLLDFSIPSAYEDPDLWDSVKFTLASDETVTFLLPPAGMGNAKVVVPPAVQIDEKGGAGKAKPKQTKTGGKATKEKITIEAIEEAWPYILAASRLLTPGSGPWLVYHPKFDICGVTQVEIPEWTDAPDFDAKEGFQIKWELHYQEIKASAQSGSGGGSATETPDGTPNAKQEALDKYNAQNGTSYATFEEAQAAAPGALQEKNAAGKEAAEARAEARDP